MATVPFLASDNEEEDDDKTATGRYLPLAYSCGGLSCTILRFCTNFDEKRLPSFPIICSIRDVS